MDNLFTSVSTGNGLLDQLDTLEQLIECGRVHELREQKIGILLLSALRDFILAANGNDVSIVGRALHLFALISGPESSTQELRILFSFFHVPSAPIDLLTGTLCQITCCKSSWSSTVRKVHYIEFPCAPKVSIELPDLSTRKNSLIHRDDHIKQSIVSGWSNSALCIPLYNLCSEKRSAITFSIWICLKRANDENYDHDNLHLMSLAYDDLYFGVWINCKRRKLKYVIGKNGKIIFEATETSYCDKFIFDEPFHLVTIWESNAEALKVRINVNGEYINRSCTTFPVGIFSIELIKYLLIGSSQEANLSYNLYTIKLFSKSLNWHEIVYLFLLGPNDEVSNASSIFELPSMNPKLGPKIVEEFLHNATIFKSCKFSLLESLYFEYPNKSRFVPCDTILLPPNMENPKEIKTINVVPFVDSTWEVSGQVIDSISDLGGINTALFLVARVFELTSDQMTQSNALKFALTVSDCHRHFKDCFINCNGCLMINQVVCSEKCAPSEDLFYSYLNHSIINSSGGNLIRSSIAFNGFFRCWRTWIRIPSQSGLLFVIVNNLLDDSVWYEMNLIQMRRANVLNEILFMLQISFLQREDGHLELLKDIDFKNLAKILQILVGTSTVHLQSLELFIKSLVLIHNSNLAFVGLSSKLFYFTVPPSMRTSRESSFQTRRSSSNSSSGEWQVIRRSPDSEVMPDAIHNRILYELLSILCTLVIDLDENRAKNVLVSILKIEHIIIWINNTSQNVRSIVLRILFESLRKSPPFTQLFLRNKYFYLLAIQMAQYEPSIDTHALILNFILGKRPFDTFDDQVSDHNWSQLKAIEAACFIPLLSFQVYSTNNSTISRYSLQIMSEIIDALPLSSPALKSLHDYSIGESLVNILRNDPEKQVMDALRIIIAVLSKKYIYSTGRIFFEVYFEMVDIFLNLSIHSAGDFSGRCWDCVITMLREGLECFKCHEDFFIDKQSSNASSRQSSFDWTSWSSIGVRVRSLNTGNSRLEYSEIVERLHHFVSRSVEILMLKDSCVSDDHKEFVRTIFQSICHFAAKISDRRSISIFFPLQKFLRSKSTQLFTFMMSPSIDPEEKVEFLLWVVKKIEYDVDKWLSKNRREFVSKLIDPCLDNMDDSTSDAIYRMFRNVAKARVTVSEKELNDWLQDLQKVRGSTMEGAKRRFDEKQLKMSTLKAELSTKANDVTNEFVADQNCERTRYIAHLKMSSREKYSTQMQYRDIVRLVTHERGVFYDEKSFPRSWQLDMTEGPSRIRRKLQRHHLDINERFLDPEHKSHCVTNKIDQPLSYLVDQSGCEIVVDYISANEESLEQNVWSHQDICFLITPQTEYQGEFLLSSTCIHFIGKSTSISENGIISKMWRIDEVDEVEPRRYQLLDNAIELFMVDGTTHLLSFNSEQARDDVCRRIGAKSCLDLATVTQLWKGRQVTTFDYLMYLNKMAGRSLNDLMIYPVFPFVLSDYKSDTIDLKNSEMFRDLKKPMAIQKKSREVYYMEQYQYLKTVAQQDVTGNPVSFPVYHYGSHYSNSGTVLHFLVRLPPFTQMFLQYQDNNFDIPDRTFHSMHVAWDLASGGSTTDFKELIPEFFFLPEFLINFQGFKFGSRLNGLPVNDVFLPNWCRRDARLFVLINRQALESDLVSNHLCHWIDLIFGHKQSGKAAVDAVNVFHPATYFGVTSSDIEDSLEIDALRTTIKTYGQMPKQLFTGPHPSRNPGKKQRKDVCHVLEEVPSLIWGDYLGSPTAAIPIVSFRKNIRRKFLMKATLTNDVFGTPPNSCLIIIYSNNKMRPLVNVSYIDKLSLLDWSNPWGHLHLIINCQDLKRREIRPVHGIDYNLDSVTVCESLSPAGVIFVGLRSGSIAVYTISRSATEIKLKSWLFGHTKSIRTIVASPEFRVIISGSEDGTCILWDSNTLSYVRTYCDIGSSIDIVCISPTLGDVAIVLKSQDQMGSRVIVQTINGQIISDFNTKVEVTAICYSGAPEGTSVNLLVAGFSDGSIQMWSSWDLTTVRTLIDSKCTGPISSICYSFDSEHLHVADDSGSLVVWTKTGHHSKHPTFTIL